MNLNFNKINGLNYGVDFNDGDNNLHFDMNCSDYFGWNVFDGLKDHWNDSDFSPDGNCDFDFTDWDFDPNFFVRLDGCTDNHLNDFDVVVFKIVKGNDHKFLHFYNIHDGYDCHPFTFNNTNGNI